MVLPPIIFVMVIELEVKYENLVSNLRSGNSKMKRKGAIRKRNNSSSKIRNESSMAINLDCVDDVVEEPIESMSNSRNLEIDQGMHKNIG